MTKVVLTLEYSEEEVARLDASFIAAFVGSLTRRDVLAERWSLTIDGLEFILPAGVELPEDAAPSALYGYRRSGPKSD